jgi:hypothetical protein
MSSLMIELLKEKYAFSKNLYQKYMWRLKIAFHIRRFSFLILVKYKGIDGTFV